MAKANKPLNSQMMIGVPAEKRPKPAFTVRKLEGTRPHRVHIFDKNDHKIKSKVIQEPAGYMVTTYKGNSIRCRSEDHLRSIGAGVRLVPLLDDKGEPVGAIENSIVLEEPEEENVE